MWKGVDRERKHKFFFFLMLIPPISEFSVNFDEAQYSCVIGMFVQSNEEINVKSELRKWTTWISSPQRYAWFFLSTRSQCSWRQSYWKDVHWTCCVNPIEREMMPTKHHYIISRTRAFNFFSLFYTVHFTLVFHFKTQTHFPSNIFGLIKNGLVELINSFTIQRSTCIRLLLLL